jgi:hypothetical protein
MSNTVELNEADLFTRCTSAQSVYVREWGAKFIVAIRVARVLH